MPPIMGKPHDHNDICLSIPIHVNRIYICGRSWDEVHATLLPFSFSPWLLNSVTVTPWTPMTRALITRWFLPFVVVAEAEAEAVVAVMVVAVAEEVEVLEE